jgi:hypothetical protein
MNSKLTTKVALLSILGITAYFDNCLALDTATSEKPWIEGTDVGEKIPEISLPSFAPVIERLGKAVVNIRTEGKEDSNKNQLDPSNPLDFFLQIPPNGGSGGGSNGSQRKFSNLGSGFVIHPDGYIVTNFHVVEGASKIFVTFKDEKSPHMASIVGGDPKTDIALLKFEKDGKYETYDGSPMSKGQFQFDMWSTEDGKPIVPLTAKDNTLDWNKLRERVAQAGQRNSLLIAPMPTASTSQIMGNNETFEPITSNIYTRRTLSGVYTVINKYLMRDLMKLQLWNEDIKQRIIIGKGSIQHIEEIPDKIKELYKTAWEIKQRTLIDMSADRGAFICQSQSLNLWVEDPTYNTLTSMHFYSWKQGLKTGIYYLRRKAKHQAQQFTIEPEVKKNEEQDEICEMCSA